MRQPGFVVCVILCLMVACPLHAQDSLNDAVRQSFAPESFARFAPRSALDMARQVPGLPIDEGESERGFGQADTNILINGRRISGKSNGPVDALRRIPADAVVRLEILDGASLDIGGLSGQVLNVVTATSGDLTGRYAYTAEFRTDHAPTQWRDFTASLSAGTETTEWTLNLGNTHDLFGIQGPEFVFDGNGELLDRREERVERMFDLPSLAGSLTHILRSGNVLNVSAEFNWFILEFSEDSIRNPIDDTPRTRLLEEAEDELNYELGADYELDVGSGKLKFIALHRYEDSPTKAQVRTTFEDNRSPLGSVFQRRAEEAETVLRAEYTNSALGGDWQWSIEGTHNFLDIDSSLRILDTTGALVLTDFPGATSRVEEDRAELTASYSRALSDTLQIQYSLGAEFSEIRQSGEIGLTREFVRPKGFISLNWAASDDLNLSVQFERRVGQLNFFDFIASLNINEDQVNVSNTNLVPPQSWVLDLELQQSLGELGSLTLSGFYEDITDIVDQIPIEGGGQAPGNIDSAERFGASMDVTLLFDTLGINGARLDLEAAYTESEVLDPLSGLRRPISDDDQIELEATLRHDFPNTAWAAGVELFYDKERPDVRLDQVSVFRASRPFTRVFVENKDVAGLTLRGSVANLNDRGLDFSRTVFSDRLANQVAFREDRFRDFGLLFRLEIEGSF